MARELASKKGILVEDGDGSEAETIDYVAPARTVFEMAKERTAHLTSHYRFDEKSEK